MSYTEDEKVSPRWFTPSSEEDEENPLQFRIKPLPGMQHLEILQKQDLRAALLSGLIDWKNFFNKHGNENKFKLSKLDALPALILSEVANEIIRISKLTGEEQKNS